MVENYNNAVLPVNNATTNNTGEVIHSPLVSSYNDKIRPILDAVDKLRRLKVTEEGIPLPTIVVVGDQSSGKSSVLESLAGISLPHGQGICTRVPLVMRLQHHPDPVPEFLLQFQGKTVRIVEESKISEAIDQATVEVAGDCKGISNVPLTLVVKKKGVSDLTMIDLPGITRVPVHQQPEDIYEQISDIIMEYIKPEDSIILNVLSAAVDFSTCESIRMSQRVDTTGQRTLAVVTKCDHSPDGLLDKVTANDVMIGLGYICVRNRINNETYEEARMQETMLFQTHHLLSKIDKSTVGIPILARRLVEIQAMIISKCLPNIVKKINERLDASVLELNKLPQNLTSIPEAMAAFMQIVGSLKETLQNILIRGEFQEYKDDKQMHCTARLVEMLDQLSKELQPGVNLQENFLVEEIQVLEEADGIWLPHFLPHHVFLCMLHRKVSGISQLPIIFVNKVCDYLETICFKVLVDHCGNYPKLLPSVRKAAQNVMVKMKEKLVQRVVEMMEMEKVADYTCDPDYSASWKKLMGETHDQFLKVIREYNTYNSSSRMYITTSTMNVEGYGFVDIKHLLSVSANIREQAFDLKMRMISYWKIVLKRLVDCIALYLRFLIEQMVTKEMQMEIVNEVMVVGGGIGELMDEPPSLALKRERLKKSIGLLQESKQVMGQVMNTIPISPV